MQFGVRKRVTFFVAYCAFRNELHFRQPEAVYLVKTFLIASVGREEAVLTLTRKGDSEVVSRTVKRRAHVIKHPNRCIFCSRVERRFIEVQAAITRMSVAGEIECPVGMHVRVHLICRRVDTFSERMGVHPFRAVQLCHPDVFSSFTSHGVAYEIQCVARRIQSRMTNRNRAIRKKLHFLRFAPFATGTLALVDLSAQIFSVNRL